MSKRRRWEKGINQNHDVMVDVDPDKEQFSIKTAPTPLSTPSFEVTEDPLKAADIPLCLQRFPWMRALPITKLKQGDSFEIPFALFAADDREITQTPTKRSIEYMRGQLRQYIQSEYEALSPHIGTRSDKTKKVITVYHRTSGRTYGAGVRVQRDKLENVSQARLLMKQHTTGIHIPPTTLGTRQRISLNQENKVAIEELLVGSVNVTATDLVNEIVADFFTQPPCREGG